MRYRFLAAAALLIVCLGPKTLAQTSGDRQPPRDPPAQRGRDSDEDSSSSWLEGLPEETRERFRVAREKALEDPKMQELHKKAQRARREFFNAMREKMLVIDPGLAEIVRKYAVERRAWKVWPGFGSLSDQEREKVLRAMEKVESDPAAEAAKQKRWEAATKDERKAATEKYRQVLRGAMARVDPTIVPILDKLGADRNPPEPSPTADEQKK
jgi:hypothetical protein